MRKRSEEKRGLKTEGKNERGTEKERGRGRQQKRDGLNPDLEDLT